jgi:hypothetical protein
MIESWRGYHMRGWSRRVVGALSLTPASRQHGQPGIVMETKFERIVGRI